MAEPVRIENWSVSRMFTGNHYLAPEYEPLRLSGEVYGHPLHPDGKRVSTSRIRLAEGRRILTNSGTVYLLGAVEPAYRQWLDENHPGLWDEQNPVKVIPSAGPWEFPALEGF